MSIDESYEEKPDKPTASQRTVAYTLLMSLSADYDKLSAKLDEVEDALVDEVQKKMALKERVAALEAKAGPLSMELRTMKDAFTAAETFAEYQKGVVDRLTKERDELRAELEKAQEAVKELR